MKLLALLTAFLTLVGCHRTEPAGTAPLQESPIRFEDVTQKAGLTFRRVNGAFGRRWMPETMGGGGAFLDYDNDGYLDILLVNGDGWTGHPLPGPRPTLALYHNNHDGTFTDVTKEAGLNISMQGMGAAVGDYDNDGWADLYVTGVGGGRLFHNEGVESRESRVESRQFVDVTVQAGVRDSGWSTSAAWLDYDNDGRLDLFVCHYLKWSPQTDLYCGTTFKAYCRPQEYPGETCRLYHNETGNREQGTGNRERKATSSLHPFIPSSPHPFFRDVTQQAGLLNEKGKSLGVCVRDLDGDGLSDLVVANDMEPNFVYHNNGNGAFSEIGLKTGLAYDDNGKARAGMGIDAADYKNDGTQGLAVGNFSYEGIAFYPLKGAPPYSERAKQTGLYAPSYPYITFGLFFADLDNDGWPDLFATNGHIEDTVSRTNPAQTYEQPSLLFRNRGDGTFVDGSRAAGGAITQPIVGRGACRGDYDNDGKVDILLLPNVGPPHLLRNVTPTPNHGLTLRLVGAKSNRDGFGAKVRVEAGGITRTAVCQSGSSYLSESDSRLHFGLGAATQADRVTVRWPSGVEEAWGPLSANRITVLQEGTGTQKR